MSQVVERLRAVHDQVSKMVAERDALRAKLSSSDHVEREHGTRIEVLKARIAELEKENEVLRSSSQPPEKGADERVATKRIDELVNEIDRCLNLLNA